jgi:hypothetical protein
VVPVSSQATIAGPLLAARNLSGLSFSSRSLGTAGLTV